MPKLRLKGKTAMAGRVPLRDLEPELSQENIVFIRQPEDSFLAAAGFTLIYFMDTPESAEAMKRGKLPYLMIPRARQLGGSGARNPITDVWKKNFQKPGTEHILGLLQAHSDEGKIFIDMMSVRPTWQRNKINSLMIDTIKCSYPKAKLTFSQPTDAGKKFINQYSPDDPMGKLPPTPKPSFSVTRRRPTTRKPESYFGNEFSS